MHTTSQHKSTDIVRPCKPNGRGRSDLCGTMLESGFEGDWNVIWPGITWEDAGMGLWIRCFSSTNSICSSGSKVDPTSENAKTHTVRARQTNHPCFARLGAARVSRGWAQTPRNPLSSRTFVGPHIVDRHEGHLLRPSDFGPLRRRTDPWVNATGPEAASSDRSDVGMSEGEVLSDRKNKSQVTNLQLDVRQVVRSWFHGQKRMSSHDSKSSPHNPTKPTTQNPSVLPGPCSFSLSTSGRSQRLSAKWMASSPLGPSTKTASSQRVQNRDWDIWDYMGSVAKNQLPILTIPAIMLVEGLHYILIEVHTQISTKAKCCTFRLEIVV